MARAKTVVIWMVAILSVDLIGAWATKEDNHREIDLNRSPVQSSSEKSITSQEPLADEIGSGEVQSSYTIEPSTQDIHLPNDQKTSSRTRRRRQRKVGLGNSHYRNYQQHREVALRLRDKAPRTMSDAERRELTNTRQYLRHVVRYNKVPGRDTEKLKDARDLLAHLQGGLWDTYEGLMGADEVWRKTESERVVMGSEKRKQQLAEENSHAAKEKKPRKLPDGALTPAQLRTRLYNKQYYAQLRAKRLEKYQKDREGLSSASTLRATSISPPSLEGGLSGWKNRKKRTQRYFVP